MTPGPSDRLQPGPRLGLGFLHVLHTMFLASLAFCSDSQTGSFLIFGYSRPIHASLTQIPQVPPPASPHLFVPEVQVRPHFSRDQCPFRFNLVFHVYVSDCELANVRGLQHRAPLVRHSSV